MSRPNKALHNWLLVGAVVSLAIAPLLLLRNAEFGGADNQAGKAISTLDPHYKPWFQPLLQPASSEVASLLFSSQAALGAGVVGYAIGLYKGRAQGRKETSKNEHSA
jgi:cobalt/nickel transport protein